jgi:hypothetical protein
MHKHQLQLPSVVHDICSYTWRKIGAIFLEGSITINISAWRGGKTYSFWSKRAKS